ncbi:MAG: PotD/PotF family extracellular solute-binding protein [Pseudomonadota bacterium]
MTSKPGFSGRLRLPRRRLLGSAVGIAGATVAAPTILKFHGALAQDKPETLNVRSWDGVWLTALRRGVSEPFSDATGIGILHDLTTDVETVPEILDAVEHGRVPPIHVEWNTAINITMLALHDATVDLGGLAGLSALLPVARPAGFAAWPFVNTYSYVFALALREGAFPAGAPTSWQILADPAVRDRIALFQDGGGFYTAAQVTGGGSLAEMPDDMAACWAFMEQVAANGARLGQDPDITGWLANGDIDACCAITSDARAARQQGADVSWTVPQEGAELATDAMCIPVGLPENEQYWAERYIETAISASSQQVWCNGLGLPPVYPGLEPPSDLVGDPAYPTTDADFDRFLMLPTPVIAENKDAWLARYRQIMGVS